jgi:hypothetical protein
LDDRGQASIELLIIALIVLAGSIAIASYYTNINDSVTAMEFLKVKVVEKTGELSYFAYIEKIYPHVSGSTIDFDLCMKSDKTLQREDLGLDEIEDWIKKPKTNFDTVNISLNSIPPC